MGQARFAGTENGKSVRIALNGDTFETAGPLTVAELLARLDLDARRVAVEHNLVIVRRAAFGDTTIRDGDTVEIVNVVGGGLT
jgi:thiamine biosynthesis protein ThiS